MPTAGPELRPMVKVILRRIKMAALSVDVPVIIAMSIQLCVLRPMSVNCKISGTTRL